MNGGSPPRDSSPTDAAASEHPLPPIADYELLRRIGRGSYGEVWLARNIMREYRAVKIIHRSRFEDDKPFRREFEGIRKFEPISRSHPSQLHVLHVGGNEVCFYYVMELADDATGESEQGEIGKEAFGTSKIRNQGSEIEPSLRASAATFDPATYVPKNLKWIFRQRGALSFEECLKHGLALAEALGHLHQHGLVHRDIKPSNIIFVNGRAKLADIGLVTEQDEERSFVGTEGYLPPEGPGSRQADIYALGKVLYELMTGLDRNKFPNLPPQWRDAANVKGLQELNYVVQRACEPRADKRFQSAEELLEELRLVRDGKSIRRLRRLEKRVKVATALTVTVALVAGIALVVQRTLTARAKHGERLRHRETLIREMQLLRLTQRHAGWSAKSWQLASNAAAIGVDEELKQQATASLCGLDARLVAELPKLAGSSLAYDSQGQRLLVGGIRTNAGQLWEAKTGKITSLSLTNPGPVAFRADNTPVQFTVQDRSNFVLIDLSAGRALIRFQAPAGAEAYIPPHHEGPPLLAMTPDATNLFAAGVVANGRREVVLWKAMSAKPLWHANFEAASIAVSPDGQWFAAGNQNGEIGVWKVDTGEQAAVLQADERTVHCLAFTPDLVRGRTPDTSLENWLLVAGDAGSTVTLWDVRKRKLRRQYHGSYYDVYSVAISPDGMTLASAGRYEVRLWDRATGRQLLRLNTVDYAWALAFSPDGRQLAACSSRRVFMDPVLRVWDLEQGSGTRTLRGLTTYMEQVALSPDGSLAAGIAQNWQVAVWDLRQNRLRHVLDVEPGIYADNAGLAFNSNGTQLAVSAHCECSLWDMSSGRVLRRWPLPQALGDTPVFDAAGRLLLCRTETRDSDQPENDYPPEKHPRVCRIRDMFHEEGGRIINEITNFDRSVRTILAPPDGRKFILHGHTIADGKNVHFVSAFEPGTARAIWAHKIETARDWTFRMDRTGRFVAFPTNDSPVFAVANVDSGMVVGILPISSTIFVEPTKWLAHVSGGGMALHANGRPHPLVTLGIDVPHTERPRFDVTGNLMVWGHNDGSVSVYDFAEMRRRLNEIGAGW